MTTHERLCPGCFLVERRDGPCSSCAWEPDPDAFHSVLDVGTVLAGKYEVGRILGRPGGFGVTYLAFDRRLHRRVAIKELMPRELVTRKRDGTTLQPHTREDRKLFEYTLGSFLEEARTLAKFSHPNVVRVLDYFEANGTAYFAMEFYEGRTLTERVESLGRSLTQSEALDVARPLLGALDAVHGAGVLHRDIKPSNVYLTREDGRPVLLDFGSARQTLGESTRTLTSVLTPGYAPFEQYHGRGDQGPWTDVYGVAATLYRLVTGRAPPEAGSRIEGEPLIPPSKLSAEVSPAFSAALVEGLSTRPEARPGSAGDFLDLLEGRSSPLAGEAGASAGPGAATELMDDGVTEVADPGAPDDRTQLAPVTSGAGGELDRTELAPAAPLPGSSTALERRTEVAPMAGPEGRASTITRWKGKAASVAGVALLAVGLPLGAVLVLDRDEPGPEEPVELVGTEGAGRGSSLTADGEAPSGPQPPGSRSGAGSGDASAGGSGDPESVSGDRSFGESTSAANRSPERDPSGETGVSDEPGASTPTSPPAQAGARRSPEPASEDARPASTETPTGVVVLLFGEGSAARQAESTLVTAMARVPGLTPLDAGALQTLRGDDDALRSALAGSFSDLARVGRQHGAAYMAVGDLTTSSRRARGRFHSGSADLDLKLYNVTTGMLVDARIFSIGSGGTPAKAALSPAAAVSEAARAVADQAAEALARWVRLDRR